MITALETSEKLNLYRRRTLPSDLDQLQDLVRRERLTGQITIHVSQGGVNSIVVEELQKLPSGPFSGSVRAGA